MTVLGVAACGSAGPNDSVTSAGGASAAASSAAPSASVPDSGTAFAGAASSLEQQYEQVVSRVLPSVVQISTSQGSGSGVVYESAAANAGIQPGDVITALVGQPVDSLAALQSVLARHKPGEHVQTRLSRTAPPPR